MVKDPASARIVVLGAGPTGIGAALRLEELGHDHYVVFEKNDFAGGLASSFVDDAGFVWDVGGHVQFSHYEYFDELMVRALADQWLEHSRESYIWIYDRFVPYPLQNNLRHLPREAMAECVLELVELGKRDPAPPQNFDDWIHSSFGDGIAKHFMMPYNFKVWAYPPREMSYSWIGERVATVDLAKVLHNILLEKDDDKWGPNSTFQFPLHGGTGAIWRALAREIPDKRLRLECPVVALDLERRTVTTHDGEEHPYDALISSLPVDVLARLSGREDLVADAAGLRYSTTHIVGVGFEGRPREELRKKCWMYFPEDNCPFYRVTLFSNYSPNNVPDATTQWSLMAEVSESSHRHVDAASVVDDVVRGMYAARLASPEDRILSRWSMVAPHGYPTPSVGRDAALQALQPKLEAMGVLSRGRFGGWKYEVSNQDHTCMQGVEAVNRILLGLPELTYPTPGVVNGWGGPVPSSVSRGESSVSDAVEAASVTR